MTFMSLNSNMTGVTNGVGTAYLSGATMIFIHFRESSTHRIFHVGD